MKKTPKNHLTIDKNMSQKELFDLLLITLEENKILESEKTILSKEKDHLIEKVKHLEAKLFASMSEKYKKDPQVFDEAKAKGTELKEDKAFLKASKTYDKQTQKIDIKVEEKELKTGGRKPIPEKYDRIDIIHDLTEDEKVCDCGCKLTQFGEEVSEQLDIIPAKIYVKRHRRLKYACKQCQENVKIAPVQNQAVPKCLAAPGLLAHTAVLKFDDHLPLYRQSEIWERLGVDISRSTLSSWILKTGAALSPLVKYMQNHIVKSGYIKADESTLQVLKTPGKKDTSKSYMWVYMTGNNEQPAVVYDYQEGRHGEYAKEFLNGFKGVLQTDGYSGYNAVTDHKKVLPLKGALHTADANSLMFIT